MKNFAVSLHEDESGPNTVEWILLIIVGLIILVAIFLFANWAIGEFRTRSDAVENDAFITGN